MKTGVLLLNFGEPDEPTLEAVVPFLERIFALNAPLMSEARPTEAQIRERSHRLAVERAPGLIAEYKEIGGSPLHRQAREQAEALHVELKSRGVENAVFLGMQFTEPSIESAVESARQAGVDRLVAIPVYPLCGPSTSVAALNEVDRQLSEQSWKVEALQVTGWHRHPAYLRLRVDAIREVLAREGLSLSDGRTRLVFSAHGTPLRYVEQGSRYVEYVEEFCLRVAKELGASDYVLGYQNHTNRPGLEWTPPDIEKAIAAVEAESVVVDAVSFMHEQSETLAELDEELREEVEGRGVRFFRVPIPYAAPSFISLLADLVQGVSGVGAARGGSPEPVRLVPCRCKSTGGAVCTNGDGRL